MTEATARIKINKLLEAAGWRLLEEEGKRPNVCLEHGTEMTIEDVWSLGDDFQDTEKGYIDFLLLDERGFPFIVLEAKSESKDPLNGKEQARRYARSQNCRFVILSNGNLHYLWDLDRGNPYIITKFPTQTSVLGYLVTEREHFGNHHFDILHCGWTIGVLTVSDLAYGADILACRYCVPMMHALQKANRNAWETSSKSHQ